MLPGQASMQLPSTPTMKTWQKVSKRRAVWGRAAEERDRGLRGGGKPSAPTADATSPAAQSCVKSTGDWHPELRWAGRGAGLQNSLPSQHGRHVYETERLWLIPETETPFFTKVFYFSKQNTGSFKSIKKFI